MVRTIADANDARNAALKRAEEAETEAEEAKNGLGAMEESLRELERKLAVEQKYKMGIQSNLKNERKKRVNNVLE